MNHIKSLATALAIALLIGCASQQKLLYNTLASVQSVTTGAFNGYLDLAVKGTIPTNSIPKISNDYNTFEQLWTAAVMVAQFNTNTVAPPVVVSASSNLLYEINVAKIAP
jgi:hypothetical protein